MRSNWRKLLLIIIIGVGCFSLGGLFFCPRLLSKPRATQFRIQEVNKIQLVVPRTEPLLQPAPRVPRMVPENLCPQMHGKVGLFVVYTNYSEYMHATNVLRCFAKSRGYEFFLVQPYEDRLAVEHCGHLADVMFRKHCVASVYLTKVDWLFVCDADTTVVQATHCLEEYLDDRADLAFYERFFSAEIMSGNYWARNTNAARRFLMNWSLIEKEAPPPPYFFSADNGAIHLQFLRTLFPDDINLHKECLSHLNRSIWPDFEPGYGPFVTCTKKALHRYGMAQEKGLAKLPYVRLKMIPRAQAWIRDMEDTRFLFWAGDFMSHSIKKTDPFQIEMLQRLASFAHGQTPPECMDPKWQPELIPQAKWISVSAMRRELKYLGEFMEQQKLKPHYANRNFHLCWPNCPLVVDTCRRNSAIPYFTQ